MRDRRRSGGGTAACYGMRLLAVGYVALLVLLPTIMVGWRTFEHGFRPVWDALRDPSVTHAFRVTAVVASVAVVCDALFGVGVALLLVRGRFPGKRLLSAFVDLPLSVSPVVVGLALVLVYGRHGWFGAELEGAGAQIIFALPGMILASVFVSFPLIVREVMPVLEEVGVEAEQAARSLGANAAQTFRRITLPAIKWALAYGVVLSLARCLGEFGAVKIVSGNLLNQTQTVTLVVEQKYQDFEQGAAYAASFVLAAIAVVCIIVISIIRPKEHA